MSSIKKTLPPSSRRTRTESREPTAAVKKARPLNNEMAYADTPKGAGINSGYAFDGAKVQQNFEISKKKEQNNG